MQDNLKNVKKPGLTTRNTIQSALSRARNKVTETVDFEQVSATQARCEIPEVRNSTDSQNSQEGAKQPFDVDEATQHTDARTTANLLSRFDDNYMNPSELDELFDRVFQSRREKEEVAECQWEKWWKQLVCKQFAPKLTTPSGEAGKGVVKLFAEELTMSNRDLDVPDARFLVCMMVVLQKETKKMNAQEIRDMMMVRVDKWRDGKFEELMDQAIENEKKFEKTGYRRPHQDAQDAEESALRMAANKFSKYMRQGNIGTAMRWGMGTQGSCTVLQPNDVVYTKKGKQRVADILAEKYPAAAPVHREAVQDIIDATSFESPTIFDITPEEVERQANNLRGSAGPSGIDAPNWARIVTAHGEASLQLRYGKDGSV